MKALVKTKKGEGFIEVREVPVPECGPDEVLIKVEAAGICGTDLHIWHDKMVYWPPVIMGHEFSGQVVKVGKNVSHWKEKDKVVAEPHTKACGVCYLCRSGNIHICPHKKAIGWGINGAFAEYIKMPSYLLHRIPENLSYNEAALTEPLAITVNCVLLTAGVKAGDVVIIEGAGTIGLMAAMIAKIAGAEKVIVTGVTQDENLRLKKARELGFETVNVEKENLEEVVFSLTQGKGADLVVEAAGVENAVNTAIKITKRLGKIAILGITGEKKINVLWDEAVFKGLDVKFCFSSNFESWERALSFMSQRKVEVLPLITHTGTITQWEKIFGELERGEGIKGLFIF